jgi:hypothetical protein
MPPNLQNLRPYKSGAEWTGNPAGRPQGLSKYIRSKLGEDGALAVNFLLGVFADRARDHKERFQAVELLLAYGWGRPPQGIALAMTDGDGGAGGPLRIRVTYSEDAGQYEDGTDDRGLAVYPHESAAPLVDYRASIGPLAPAPTAAHPQPEPIPEAAPKAEAALPALAGVRWSPR